MIGILLIEMSGYIGRLLRCEDIRHKIMYCERHSNVETRLGCSKCGTLICVKCLTQTPVGARCPDCALVSRPPTLEFGAGILLRALGTGIVMSGVTGFLWGFLFFALFSIPFLPWIAIVGIGYAIGEAISTSVNRKRGRYLQYIAGASVIFSYAVAGFINPLIFGITLPNLFFLLMLGVGVFIATSRVG